MKILIIEDEEAIRETFQILLEFNGHTVLAAADGPAGIALAHQRPELIFCDVGMPGMNGYEVIDAIRQLADCQDIPFIFLTARADRDDQRRGMALGADDYITKPFTVRDILDAIAARVRRQQPLRARLEQLLAQHRAEAAADWSHELMTPLNGVLGGLELIETEIDTIQPGELRQLLALIRTSAERQHALSRKIVLYFELERAKASPPPTRPFRCEALPTILAGATLAAEESKRTADLTVACTPTALPLAESRLAGAVREIVDNAFRFSASGQPVTVTGTLHGDRYHLAITDRGAGLSDAERAEVRAFAQFDRSHREQQGLGLGLALARSAAELAGGRLTLQPGPDARGLTVVFDLPVAG